MEHVHKIKQRCYTIRWQRELWNRESWDEQLDFTLKEFFPRGWLAYQLLTTCGHCSNGGQQMGSYLSALPTLKKRLINNTLGWIRVDGKKNVGIRIKRMSNYTWNELDFVDSSAR